MKKIKSDQLCVMISATCFIDADKLMMYSINTGEVKPYKDIEESDIGNWIIEDSVQVLRDCDELDHDNIEITEA